MKINLMKLSALLLSFSLLTACSQNRFMDLGGFVYNFNYVSENKIDFEDIYSYTDEGDRVFEVFIDDEDPSVVLKLLTENDRIKQIRIAVAKRDENGKKITPSVETLSAFTQTVKSAVRAYCAFDESRADTIIKEFSLYEKNTYSKVGELSKNEENFNFTYYSDSFVCDMIISDNYLLITEKAEKPESKPAFGNTTNVRKETEPLPSFKSGS